MYYYDIYGWLSDSPIEGRSTDIAPPEDIPEGQKPNWSGVAWMLLDYPPVVLPEITQQILPIADFMLRFPADVPGRALMLMKTNPRLAASWQMLFTQPEIKLDHQLLIRELDYLATMEDADGPLLSAEDRAALTA